MANCLGAVTTQRAPSTHGSDDGTCLRAVDEQPGRVPVIDPTVVCATDGGFFHSCRREDNDSMEVTGREPHGSDVRKPVVILERDCM